MDIPPDNDVPAPLDHSDWPVNDGWGIFFLPAGQALVLDGAAYRETLRRGTLLDLSDADVPATDESSTALEEHMRAMLADGLSADVRLVVRRGDGRGELELSAHKCVLASRSAYFRALFLSEFRERSQSRVPLEDITPEQCLLLLNFIYADDWMVEDQDFALDMIPIADRFSVLDLKRLCERTLICTMSVENVARIFALADRYACNRLRSRALLFMTDTHHFHLVMKTESFAELDKVLILEILHSHKSAPAPAALPSEPLPGNSATASKAGQSKSRDHRHARGGAGAGGAGTARPVSVAAAAAAAEHGRGNAATSASTSASAGASAGTSANASATATTSASSTSAAPQSTAPHSSTLTAGPDEPAPSNAAAASSMPASLGSTASGSSPSTGSAASASAASPAPAAAPLNPPITAAPGSAAGSASTAEAGGTNALSSSPEKPITDNNGLATSSSWGSSTADDPPPLDFSSSNSAAAASPSGVASTSAAPTSATAGPQLPVG